MSMEVCLDCKFFVADSLLITRIAAIMTQSTYFLVGGLEHQFYFPINIGNVIIPIDELIFFRGFFSTTNQFFSKTNLPSGNQVLFFGWKIPLFTNGSCTRVLGYPRHVCCHRRVYRCIHSTIRYSHSNPIFDRHFESLKRKPSILKGTIYI